MHPYVRERLPQLAELCRRYHVRRLDLFGSGTGERFDPATSDLDFIVDFDPSVADRFNTYFGFKEETEALFGRHVDLVESGASKRPHVRTELDSTKELVYAA